MILRKATIKYSGRDPDKLPAKSNYRVCVSCDNPECKNPIRWVRKDNYHPLCQSCAAKKRPPMSDENRKKMSESRSGENNPMFGSCKVGKNAPNWKGGITGVRDHVLPINQCLQINQRFKNSHAHHISANVVVYIPGELHNHLYHNMKNGEGIYEINMLSLQYLKGEL